MDKRRRPVAVRFWEKVKKSDQCWVWQAGGHPRGYGRFRAEGGALVWAHRWSYQQAYGAIPRGLGLDHLCRNPSCVRPDHLEPVTQKTNVLRGVSFAADNARKSECPAGHPLGGPNLYLNPAGRRECRACRKYHQQQRRARTKEQNRHVR